jgi:hypothetical protein
MSDGGGRTVASWSRCYCRCRRLRVSQEDSFRNHGTRCFGGLTSRSAPDRIDIIFNGVGVEESDLFCGIVALRRGGAA